MSIFQAFLGHFCEDIYETKLLLGHNGTVLSALSGVLGSVSFISPLKTSLAHRDSCDLTVLP